MNKKDYLEKRNAMLADAQAFIDSGEIEKSNETMENVKKLDSNFENTATAQANLNAMNGVAINVPNHVLNNSSVNLAGVVEENPSMEDMYNSVEYKMAFMRNTLCGEAIPQKFVNANANTKTSDVGSVIPTTTMEKIIEKIESTGMILPLVTRTSYQGGLAIPSSSVKPTATWVAEGAGSDKQKKTTGSITFNYYKLRCAISVSLEVETTTYAIFETVFVNNVVEAMTKAIEQAIINGDGSGKPKGFLKETPVANIDIAKAGKLDYKTLVSAEAALPMAYENDAVWFMTKSTFMGFIGMTDTNGQPIARINYGINGRPERTLLGRTVVLNEYMSSYTDAPTENIIFGALYAPKNYVLNTNYQMTVSKYVDNDTEDKITKAVTLVDGKSVDNNSLVTLTKKNA